MKNSELIQLLDIEKSLVYFSSSLKGSEITIEKISRGRVIKLYEDDQDLLEDVLIEVRQAIEMSSIYLNILSGTMDAFASVISNNLNIVMKVLASITLLTVSYTHLGRHRFPIFGGDGLRTGLWPKFASFNSASGYHLYCGDPLRLSLIHIWIVERALGVFQI